MESSSIGNGGVSASERMRKDSAFTSSSPVARFSLTAPERAITSPSTAMTNSLRSFAAFSKPSSLIGPFSKIICIIPLLSRRSTKIIPPLLRLFCTQPIRVTFFPISAFVTSAQRQVLFRPFMDSAIFLFLLFGTADTKNLHPQHIVFSCDYYYWIFLTFCQQKILRSQCNPRWQAALSGISCSSSSRRC